jgi:hypothetical protein
MLAGVEAAGECASTRMARAAKAIDNGLAARDLLGGRRHLEVRNGSSTGMLLDYPRERKRTCG